MISQQEVVLKLLKCVSELLPNGKGGLGLHHVVSVVELQHSVLMKPSPGVLVDCPVGSPGSVRCLARRIPSVQMPPMFEEHEQRKLWSHN